jgi:hypothetical protein
LDSSKRKPVTVEWWAKGTWYRRWEVLEDGRIENRFI